MKSIVLLLALIFSASNYAFDVCYNFPKFKKELKVYKGKISDISTELSFSDCPRSVLINGHLVMGHSQVLDLEGKVLCVYSNGLAQSFACTL